MVADLLCKNITHFSSKNKADFQGGGEEKINCFTLACTNKKKTEIVYYLRESTQQKFSFCLRDNPNSILDFDLTTIAGLIKVFYMTPGFSQKTGFFRGQPRPNPDPDPVS